MQGLWKFIRENNFFPLSISKQSWTQRFIILLLIFTFLFIYSLGLYEDSAENLLNNDNIKLSKMSSEYFDNKRELNFYANIWCYKEYQKVLKKNPNLDKSLIKPKYPILKKLISYLFAVENVFVPANSIEIIEQFRGIIGSGVEVVTNDGKTLFYKSNSREYVKKDLIPNKLKRAFVYAEDKYFDIEPAGLNIVRTLYAALNHFKNGSKKGNSSITEQVYKLYFGSTKHKAKKDKFFQLLGASYLSYYSKSRDDILNLYVQSIPGSYWGGHCYGAYSISKNYLSKENLNDLTTREMAWLSRIALYPNSHGQHYANYCIVNKEFIKQGYYIGNDIDIKSFINNSDENQKFLKSVRFKQIEESEITTKELNDWVKDLRLAYHITNKRVNTVLDDFKNGDAMLKPLISDISYSNSLNEELLFHTPIMIIDKQNYLDLTRKNIKETFTDWFMNAGLKFVVAYDENAQKILDEELESTCKITERNNRKKYGGGSVLVKTHNIKDGTIQNKVVAVSSRHPIKGESFNWAVDGLRHFGSIFKWLATLLYFENGGTALDSYYDIPRVFENGNGDTDYRPDNWKAK